MASPEDATPQERAEVPEQNTDEGVTLTSAKKKKTEPEIKGRGATLPKPKKDEKYWWLTFNEKVRTGDPESVTLGCQGEILDFPRNERTPVPQRFREVADHTRYPHYVPVAGEEYKKTEWRKTYPYQVDGEATRADFVAWLKKYKKLRSGK